MLTGRYDHRAMRSLLHRANGHRGLNVLRTALATLDDAPRTTRSGLERAFLTFCHEHSLPLPQTNALLHGYEVDAHWPRARLVVELDGHAVHSTPQAFARDRERDRKLSALGYRVVRVTARQLHAEAAADLRQLLASRGAGAAAGGSATAI